LTKFVVFKFGYLSAYVAVLVIVPLHYRTT